MKRPAEVFTRIGLLVTALALGFGALEIAARLWLQHLASPARYQAYASLRQIQARPALPHRLMPHRHLGFVPSPGFRRGLDRHNSLGFRGDEIAMPKRDGVFRIVCLGGSTTYSVSVADPADAYPAQLEKALHESGWPNVEVVNAGVAGYGSLESLIYLGLRVLDLQPDMILVIHAANDVHARLVWPPSAYRGDNSGSRGTPGLAPMPSVFEHSTALRIAMVRLGWVEAHSHLERAFGTPETGFARLFYDQIADASYPSGIFEQVPIREMLARNPPIYFERNLRNLITLAGAHSAQVLLATLPYHPRWTGRSPIAVAAYRDGLAEMNRLTLRITETSAAHGFDLAGRMPVDRALYVDGYHCTREGNESRARLLAEWIAGSGLIEPGVPRSRPAGS